MFPSFPLPKCRKLKITSKLAPDGLNQPYVRRVVEKDNRGFENPRACYSRFRISASSTLRSAQVRVACIACYISSPGVVSRRGNDAVARASVYFISGVAFISITELTDSN